MTTFELANHVYQIHTAIIPLILGLIAGAAQAVGNTQKEAGQRRLASATARYSPWTHMSPNAVQYANPMGDILAGGMAGLDYQQKNPAATLASAPTNGVTAGMQAGLELDPASNPSDTNPSDAIPELGGAPSSLSALQPPKRSQALFNPWGGFGGKRYV